MSDGARPGEKNPDAAHRGRLGLTLLVAGTFFMENLDGTILSTAAPSIARSFHVDSPSVSVAITAYLLTLAVVIPLSGWLTDRIGARPVFITAIAIFTLASAACAFSTSLTMLTVLRIVQAIGGAMMVPVGRLVVLRSTRKSDIIRAIAWLTWPALFAPVVAPFLGGLITTYASWPWIFLLNIPLGIAGVVAAIALVPTSTRILDRPLDWIGFLLLASGLGLVGFAGAVFSEARPDLLLGLVTLAAGLILTGGAAVHLVRATRPLFDLRVFGTETFRVSHAGGGLFRLTILAMPFMLALFLQDALGWSPVQAGSVILTLFVGNLAIKVATTPLLVRFGFRPVLMVATAGAVVSILLTAFVTGATPVAVIIVLLFFSGVFRSIGFTAYNTIAFADIPEVELSDANTLASTVQQVASALGVAVGAIALQLGQPIARALGDSSTVAPFRIAFLLIAALAAVAFVESLTLTRGAGDNIRPKRPVRV